MSVFCKPKDVLSDFDKNGLVYEIKGATKERSKEAEAPSLIQIKVNKKR